ADTATGGTGPRRHHLPEQRALHGLHLTATATGVAGYRRGIAVGALALTAVAQYRGVDGDLLGDAGCALLEVQAHPQQRVRTRPHPANGAARCRSPGEAAAEECLEYIAQTTEPGEATG